MMRRVLQLIAITVFLSAPGLVRAIEVVQVTSPGGLTAWLAEDHANPIVSVRFSFKGGAALDGAGREGLANLASGLLDEGAEALDSQTFQAALADNAIELRYNAGMDRFSGRLKTLTGNLDLAANLVNLSLTAPRFDPEPVARIKSQIVAGIRQDMERPGTIANDAFFARLFPDHGYGRRVEGSEASVMALTADDLKAFAAERLAKSNLIVGVSGDITPDQLAAFLDRAFLGLPDAPKDGHVADVPPHAQGQLTVIELDVPQSVILFGHEGLNREDPDFYTALVMNHILGGGSFTSRLYTQVREERGLAYSVGSGLYPLDHSALILGQSGTENARVAETVAVIRDEWRKMAESGASTQEIHDAKTFLTGAFPLRFTNTGKVASVLVGMQISNLGIDYLANRNGFIDVVTEADVRRVAARLLKPQGLEIIVVGKPDGLISE